MEQSTLDEILRKHDLWINDMDGGERANLRSANLRYANLRSAKNLILLPVADYRGYMHAHAVCKEDGAWLIRSGCRSIDINAAKTHWGEGYKGDRDIGDMYLYAIEWLEKKLAKEKE